MHPDPPHDPARDAVLDGRDSLRLVKLRLGLTLIAVAVLPIAAVSPLVRAVAEEARATHHDRLADQASTASIEVRRELELLRTAEQEMLADPVIIAPDLCEEFAATIYYIWVFFKICCAIYHAKHFNNTFYFVE